MLSRDRKIIFREDHPLKASRHAYLALLPLVLPEMEHPLWVITCGALMPVDEVAALTRRGKANRSPNPNADHNIIRNVLHRGARIHRMLLAVGMLVTVRRPYHPS